jgi:hypothetical protein
MPLTIRRLFRIRRVNTVEIPDSHEVSSKVWMTSRDKAGLKSTSAVCWRPVQLQL